MIFNNKFISDSLTVAIVEDDVINQLILKKMLLAHGIKNIFQYGSGEASIESIKEGCPRFDVIIMDIGLGGLDGIDTAKEINRIHQGHKFIFLTGYDDNETRDKAMETNAIGYMIKPVDVKDLLDNIRKINQ